LRRTRGGFARGIGLNPLGDRVTPWFGGVEKCLPGKDISGDDAHYLIIIHNDPPPHLSRRVKKLKFV
jgi:hypothetical protein